ncbi:hypothetical protein BD289DRAFT_262561 [Coniella lustricola]|uniref:Uncharacterized protein n=1 Tax=Coniella lustricola TaxID=2025994 RepID=A0A2T3A7R5_9PEZI|nr:hypothetical protein BD289DRAFT_262561 [Coniella lustricola]
MPVAPCQQQWRIKFRARLLLAASAMEAPPPLTTTFIQHMTAFRDHMAQHKEFEKEVQKLAPFEFEVFSIASTKKQLENDAMYFSADEVASTFQQFPRAKVQRQEVRRLLLSDNKYILSVAYKATRVNDERPIISELKERIKTYLSPSATQELCSGEYNKDSFNSEADISMQNYSRSLPQDFRLRLF